MENDYESIKVNIMSPEEVVWEGEVEGLSSKNTEGPYDILPGHANFMTLVKDTEVTLYFKGGESRSFPFDQAVLFFNNNVAKIYAHTPEAKQELKGDTV